jgi:hypothetical protein
MRPSFRVTSSRNVCPALEDLRRTALTKVMATSEDSPLTIVSFHTRLSIYTKLLRLSRPI